jgi:hypothetical protein
LSRDDNLPQTICNVCVQKLNSIIEFRMIILNSDAQLKSQQIIVGRLKEALSAAIKRPQKHVQKSENQVCGDPASYVYEDIKVDIDNVKLEIDDIKLEIDDTIKEQNSEENENKKGARHKEYKQKSKKKLYSCEECGKTFRYNSQYVAHNSRHTGEMPYHCDICNKGFLVKCFMLYHRRIHLDEQPFKCDECTKAFKYFFFK